MIIISRGLHAIGNGCKKLKDLTLSDCYFLSDKGMETIAAGCKELTHLEVNGCHNIGTLGLEFIGKSCPYVLSFKLQKLLTGQGFVELHDFTHDLKIEHKICIIHQLHICLHA